MNETQSFENVTSGENIILLFYCNFNLIKYVKVCVPGKLISIVKVILCLLPVLVISF